MRRVSAGDAATCPEEALSPPKSTAAGIIPSGWCRAMNETRIPVKPVACDDRGVRLVVDGGHFDHARQPGRGSAEEARHQDQHANRQVRRPAPPGYCRRPSARQNRMSCDPSGSKSSTQAATPYANPQCTSRPNIEPSMAASGIGYVDGLFETRRIANRPSTRKLKTINGK